MISYPKLSAETNIDSRVDCHVRFVYGGVEGYFPHSHDYYEVFIVDKGPVPHMIKGKLQNLPEGALVFIRPDDVHSHICSDPETAFINFTFSRETAHTLFAYLFEREKIQHLLSCDMPPMLFLDKTSKKRLITQINEFNTENWQDKNALKTRMRTILVNIFSYFAESSLQSSPGASPIWLIELTNKMSDPKNFISGIDRMIELGGKSREHLSRSFKKHYGITITDYLNGLRINYASNLLINTNIPIIDICFNCGFQSVSYFYRVFKEKNGVTPSIFRKNYK